MFTNVYLAEIMRLSTEVNDGGIYTVFCNFSGHVKGLHVRVYEGSWKEKNDEIFDINIYTDTSRSEEALKQIIVQLTQLLN